MDSAERNLLIEAYRTGPTLIREALRGIDNRLLDQRPAGSEWSIREIGHHVVDAEVMAAARLRRLLAEAAPSIPPYDEAEFARRLHYERPLDSALDLLTASRNANADLLEVLSDADWERQGTHPEFSAYSVEYLVRRAADHCSQHVEQIGRTFAAVAGASEDRHERWTRALAAADRLRDKFGESAVSLAASMRGKFRERTHENPTGLPGKKPGETAP